ncbi:MAG TPA: tetratricopeptide repeat protein [Bacteroidales bacterium]|nr:tetratricopeptide repeat protein [Bacteroidales bacterium]HRZ49239.1 tetratricopeptide repeat protein [Bacteroidales bacterium]
MKKNWLIPSILLIFIIAIYLLGCIQTSKNQNQTSKSALRDDASEDTSLQVTPYMNDSKSIEADTIAVIKSNNEGKFVAKSKKESNAPELKERDDYFKLGVIKFQQGEYNEAYMNFWLATNLDPNHYESYGYLGDISFYQNQYQNAINQYSKAIEIRPNDPLNYHNRSRAKQELGDFNGSIADNNKAISLNKNYVDAFEGRAMAKMNLGDYRGAILDFSKVIELTPNNSMSYYGRGLAQIFIGQKESGCLDLSKAGELGYTKVYSEIRKYCN